MPKPYKTLLLSAVLITASSSLNAGSVTSTVNFVQINNSQNRAYVQFNTAPTAQPACATDARMTLDLTTYGGRAAFNLALTAKASGKRLYAAGTNSCFSRYEKINYLRLL